MMPDSYAHANPNCRHHSRHLLFLHRYGITRVWVYWSMPPARGSPPSAPFPNMPPLPPGPPYPPYANGLGDTKTVRQRLMLELLSSDTAAADGAVDSEGDYLGQQGTGSGDGGGSGAAVAATRSGGGVRGGAGEKATAPEHPRQRRQQQQQQGWKEGGEGDGADVEWVDEESEWVDEGSKKAGATTGTAATTTTRGATNNNTTTTADSWLGAGTGHRSYRRDDWSYGR